MRKHEVEGSIIEETRNGRAEDAKTDSDIDNHLKGILNGGFGLIQGLGISLKHLFEPTVTIEYPEQRWEPQPGFRGIPVLPWDDENDVIKCVGCQACARVCPPQVIHIETSRRPGQKRLEIDEFSIDMTRCMLCNLCVEACPFEAITMSSHYELGDFELEGIIFDKEELVRLWRETPTAMILAGHSWQPDDADDPGVRADE